MRVGSLFSGGGMGDFGLMMAGMEIAFQVEQDEYCRKILELRWPGLPRWGDIRTVDPEDLPPVDLISGGFPCQPVSVAGKRRGDQDDRWLWPEMLRIIQGVRPTWCLCENVSGIVSLGLDGVLSDLESAGYSCQAFIIPACAVNAPHRRDRVWIVARNSDCWNRVEKGEDTEPTGVCADVAHTKEPGLEGGDRARQTRSNGCPTKPGPRGWRDNWWATEPGVCGISHGTPDRVERLKLLGNGIVAPLVAEIGRMIMKVQR